MKIFLAIILYIWQLPQNLIGLILRLFYIHSEKIEIDGIKVWYNKSFRGGISLGNTILTGSKNVFTAKHEHGHQIQSMILGPFYLFVIGIPSICWAWMYGTIIPWTYNGYFKFYTESWADKLGKVIRN